jgi:hypothetical protein
MTQRGYRRYKGKWMLQQEIDILEKKQKQETDQQAWYAKLKQWRSWIGTRREEDGIANVREISDPAAVEAIGTFLDKEKRPEVRRLYVDALLKIDSADAVRAVAFHVIPESDEELRDICLDYLAKKKQPDVTSFFMGKLNPKKNDNPTINLAGAILGRLKDPAAIPALIDSLVTSHKFKNPKSGGDNAVAPTFTQGPGHTGGTGMTAGSGPKFVVRLFQNQNVLDALVTITGQGFGFDQAAWRQWYSERKKSEKPANSRRN